jgi:hypothetical protein
MQNNHMSAAKMLQLVSGLTANDQWANGDRNTELYIAISPCGGGFRIPPP